MKTYILRFLADLGLLEEVPKEKPPPRTVLARCACFLHGGDNPSALLLYADGFACTTRKCHQDRRFGCNLEGLVRHLVYAATDEVMSWRPSWEYARKNVEALKSLIPARVLAGRRNDLQADLDLWADVNLADYLTVPDAYYLGRGYRPETLKHFGVGTSRRTLPDGRNLLGWAVIPVRRHGRLVGYTARNPWFKKGDPDSAKWRHGLKRDYLFNDGLFLHEHNHLFICEGPGCVMRLHEAGFPGAVATLGSGMTEGQFGRFLSIRQRDTQVYVAPDADEAGRQFAEQVLGEIRGVCESRPPIVVYPPAGRKDFGDCTVAEIRALGLSKATAA